MNDSKIIASCEKMASDNEAEMLPVVNEDGEVVGRATRDECHNGYKTGCKPLHPVVHLQLFNSEGEIYLQKRPEWKKIQPGKWDTAVGGHVDAGENITAALRREVEEEIGLAGIVYEYIGCYVFESDVERELVYVFSCVTDNKPKPAAGELDGGAFFSKDNLHNAFNQGLLTPNFVGEYERFFGKLYNHVFKYMKCPQTTK